MAHLLVYPDAWHPLGFGPACGPRETATNTVPAAGSEPGLGTPGPQAGKPIGADAPMQTKDRSPLAIPAQFFNSTFQNSGTGE
jgi:hypothetical protein